MKGLTSKQSQILKFIETFIEQFNYAPSYREIMRHFSLNSPASVYKHVQTLKRKGVLKGEERCSRSIFPVSNDLKIAKEAGTIDLAFVGHVAAHHPIEMFLTPQVLSVPSHLVRATDCTYLFRVQGNGFQTESIEDGDLLLIEVRQEAQSAEMVLGLLDNREAIIKRYFPEGQYIRLESVRSDLSPLSVRQESFFTQGIVVGLIRSF